MKIIITGGLGFIGSNLTRTLNADGHELTIITRSREKIFNIREIENDVRIIDCDVNQLGDIQDIEKIISSHDVIFHLAGSMGNYNILDNPQYDIENNCGTTMTLLDLCRQYNPQVNFVYISAFFVHGKVDTLPVKEDLPCNPVSLFGATRLAGEHFCHIYNNIYDMNIKIARLSNVYGIREQMTNKKKAAYNYLLCLAMEDKNIPMYGKGHYLRDLIYVDDVVSALNVIMLNGERDEIYLVGNGVGVTLADYLSIVVSEAGAGTIEYIIPPDFHNRIGITDFVCDVSKLRSLGWNPSVEIREGIRRTIQFYREFDNRIHYIEEPEMLNE